MSDFRTLHQKLLTSVKSKDFKTAATTLTQLKLALLERNALLPSSDVSPADLGAAREILEMGAFVSIHLHDDEAFSRYYAQLQPFYADAVLNKVPSPNKNKIIGLYLLSLLTKNATAEFHTALENLEGYEEDVFVRYPVMLERWLMEGSYDKVWQATKSSQVPSEEYAKFSEVSSILVTGRDGANMARRWSALSDKRSRTARRKHTNRCRYRMLNSCFSWTPRVQSLSSRERFDLCFPNRS